MKWTRVCLIGTLLALTAGRFAGAQAPATDSNPDLKTNRVRSWHFSKVDKDAGMWSAIYAASNDKIYIGLCTHANTATLYEFDIKTEQMRQLANLAELLDESGKGIWTNGKIHTTMQELDGYVYFSSFCEDNGPPEFDAGTYEGPRWFRVEMATGRVDVLSKINNYWGLIGQCMDKERRLIYGLAEDGHLYKYYIDDDWTEDLGRVDNWDICRTIITDDKGRVYGSYAPSMIWRYDPETDTLEDLQQLRVPATLDSRSKANPMLDRRSQWRYIEWDPDSKRAYGLTGNSCVLFEYDVNAELEGPWTQYNNSDGKITPLAQICAPMYRGVHPVDIPSATLAMTLSRVERKIYYLPVISGDFDYGQVDTDPTIGKEVKKETIERPPPQSYMVSYDLETGEVEDIGLLRTQDGHQVYGMGGAETDSQGRIWFVGAFEETDPDYIARRVSPNYAFSMGLGCYDPNDH